MSKESPKLRWPRVIGFCLIYGAVISFVASLGVIAILGHKPEHFSTILSAFIAASIPVILSKYPNWFHK